MRRSELDPKLSELAQRLFVGSRDVLAIGITGGLGDRDVFVVDEPAQALALRRQFGALLYRLPADVTAARLRAALVALRPALVDGAVILLAADKRAPALDQLRAVFAREPLPRARLDALCEALLLSGLSAPRQHEEPTSGWLLVSAAVPAEPCALDAFFSQPATDPSR
ncbi:MAG: hypothetical protein RLZZ450_5583 [Pseudomonadota bacterium]|jgi:hypothetical protein